MPKSTHLFRIFSFAPTGLATGSWSASILFDYTSPRFHEGGRIFPWGYFAAREARAANMVLKLTDIALMKGFNRSH
jgi:hypothetical protein